MPAGTGVWVVKTVEARPISSAVSQSTFGPSSATVSSRIRSTPRKPAWPSLVWNTSGAGMAGDPAVDAQRADPADAEEQLLAQPVLAVAAVEPVGDVDVVLGVALDVGVEHQQRHPADAGHPDPGDQRRAVGQVDRDRGAGAVGLAQQRDRQAVGVEDRVGLLLPALAGQRLLEVAVPVEQPDADDRHAEVAGRLEVVAGQDAEAAGVLRQHGGDAELGREVADRARGRPGPGAGTTGPRRGTPPGRARRRRAARRTRGRRPAPRTGPCRTSPSSRTGSRPVDSQSSGSTAAKTSWVGGCQDHLRLLARSPSAESASGSTGRTVKRRMARTRRR